MKYNPPLKKAADASYVDGNRNLGLRGDTPPAAAIEHPQREIVHVVEHAGLTPKEDDLQQLRKAIEAIIESKTAGGEEANYLTLLQASSRLLFYPEVQSETGHFAVVAVGTGQVRVPAGVPFLHRGISPYTSEQTDLTTEPNKTYHLRWNKTDSFHLKDLASGVYNPGAVPETHRRFDSKYDDMLVALVVTNGLNAPSVVNLINRHQLEASGETTIADNNPYENDKRPSQITAGDPVVLNWARSPKVALQAVTDLEAWATEVSFGAVAKSRYQFKTFYQYTPTGNYGGYFAYEAWA